MSGFTFNVGILHLMSGFTFNGEATQTSAESWILDRFRRPTAKIKALEASCRLRAFNPCGNEQGERSKGCSIIMLNKAKIDFF